MKIIYQLIALTLSYLMATTAFGEEFSIKETKVAKDYNSVDLLSGQYHPNLPTLSIPAAPNLSLQTLQKFDSKIKGILYDSGAILGLDIEGRVEMNFTQSERLEAFSLTFGGSTSESFVCADYECLPSIDTGSKLLGNMTNKVFRYTQGGSGIIVRYSLQSSFFDYSLDPYSDKALEGTWYATRIEFPDGEQLDISYDTAVLGVVTFYRPVKLTTNRGYELHIAYSSNDIHTGTSGWSQLANAYIVKTGSPLIKLAQYTYANGAITDLSGRSWQYTGFNNALGSFDSSKNFTMKLPNNAADGIAVDSAYKIYGRTLHNNFVTSVSRAGMTYHYAYTAKTGTGYNPREQFSKVVITGPGGYERTVDLEPWQAPNNGHSLITADTNSLGQTTRYTYTGGRRIKSVVYPEGNQEEFTYDPYHNIIAKRSKAKPGSGIADIVVTADYDVNLCTGILCFRPKTSTDAKGKVTDYTFDHLHGGLLTKLTPAAANGKRIKTTHTYQTINGLSRRVKTSVCAESDCGSKNEQITLTSYWGNSLLPSQVTLTDGSSSLSQTTTYSYDNAGRLLVSDGPLPGLDDATYYRYDVIGRAIWEIAPVNQSGHRAAKRLTYRDQDNQLLTIETGTLPNATSTNLSVTLTETNVYSIHGLLLTSKVKSPTQTQTLVQNTYDSSNRVSCSTRRMNPLKFSGLPLSACTLGDEGGYGPDRITRNYYDTLSRTTKTISGYNTPDAGIDIEMGYTTNGQVATRKDGNGNTTSYSYDGFDRLKRTTFPDASYEHHTYDVKSNLKTYRKRDGKVLTHYYDALNSKTKTVVPNESSIVFTYDGLARQTKVARGSSYVSYSYDGLGRLKTSNTNGKVLTYRFDAAGRRSRLDYPDSYFTTYQYDAAGALTTIKEKGGLNLVSYSYTNLGRLKTISRANGVTSSLDYDAPGRIKNYDHSGLNEASFEYNPDSDIIRRVVSNPAFQSAIPDIDSQNYDTNVLNQYTKVGNSNISYDLAANLTSYDGWNYVYNAHNRLTSASKSGTSLALAYDATGRLNSATHNGTKTTFLYDGDELIAEYNASGTLLRRYVHGIGVDDPLVWYEGTGTSNKRYLIADERGSIIAETNNSGSLITTHQYGPFGEPVDSSTARFRYTGQILLPGTELYHYKARVYHPELGRFLQTDPLGYQDGMNWYAYVQNNPYKYNDPDGRSAKTKILSEAAKAVKKERDRLINNAKARARRARLKQEEKSLRETGESLSDLSTKREKELLETGKLKGMHNHHEPTVSSGKTLEEKIKIAENPNNTTFKEPSDHRARHSEFGGPQVPITTSMMAGGLTVVANGLELLSYIPDPTILIEVQSLACSDMRCPAEQ